MDDDSQISSGTSCPTDAQLRSIVCDARAVDDDLVHHLEHCTACQNTLDQIARQDRLVTKVSVPLLNSNWHSAAPRLAGRIAEQARIDRHATPAGVENPSSVTVRLPEIAGYEILGLLGRGGMGAVYDAIQLRFGRPVAIKVLPEASRTKPQVLRRFFREMVAIGKLDHAGIVQAYDAAEDNGIHYLVMEKVDGVTVSQIAGDCGRLSISDSCEIIRQASIALQHAYDHGLVHRDIKPSNMMINVDGVVKLLDLGLARLSQEDDESLHELTMTGQILGTIDYMAPEQAAGQSDIGIAADIYSLGATLYRLVTGRPLFDFLSHASVLSKLNAIVSVMPAPVRQLRPEIPAELEAIISKLLQKEPQLRYLQPSDVAVSIAPFCVDANLVSIGRKSKAEEDSRSLIHAETANMANVDPTIQNFAHPAAAVPANRPSTLSRVRNHRALLISILMMGFVSAVLIIRFLDSARTDSSNRMEAGLIKDNAAGTVETNTPVDPSVLNRTPAPNLDDFEGPFPSDPESAKQHQANWARERDLDVERIVELSDDQSLTMVLIPPGRFMMGDAGMQHSAARDTTPHPVEITKPFRLAKYETTHGQFRRFIEETGYQTDAERGDGSIGIIDGKWIKDKRFHWNSSAGQPRADQDPVIHVTRGDAAEFCKWLSNQDPGHVYALPTEAQWEYACRAGTSTYLYFSESIADVHQASWNFRNSNWRSRSVGQFPPNPFGIHDLYGNVSEMCRDRYGFNYYQHSERKDPLGPLVGSTFVYRGGCWSDPAPSCNSVIRRHYPIEDRSLCAGFRVSSMDENVVPKK